MSCPFLIPSVQCVFFLSPRCFGGDINYLRPAMSECLLVTSCHISSPLCYLEYVWKVNQDVKMAAFLRPTFLSSQIPVEGPKVVLLGCYAVRPSSTTLWHTFKTLTHLWWYWNSYLLGCMAFWSLPATGRGCAASCCKIILKAVILKAAFRAWPSLKRNFLMAKVSVLCLQRLWKYFSSYF